MIANERQYKITQTAIRRFKEGLETASHREPSSGVHPRIHEAMADGIRSQIEDLQEQVDDYERLRRGDTRERVFETLSDMARGLIEARIAAGLSQRALADVLGVPEQEIQRYESTNFAGASFRRLQEMSSVLGVDVELHVHYAPGLGRLTAQLSGFDGKVAQFNADAAA